LKISLARPSQKLSKLNGHRVTDNLRTKGEIKVGLARGELILYLGVRTALEVP
jgi:hypothetical protein